MRNRFFIAALVPLLAVLAIASAPVPVPSSRGVAVQPVQAELEAPSDTAASTPLHSIGEVFTPGLGVEVPRRLVGGRLQSVARLAHALAADAPARAALLKLREAKRTRRAIGDALERDAAGTTSFHTATPPPHTLA